MSTLDEVRRVGERKRTVAKIGGGGAGGKKKKKKITRKQADGVRRDQLVDVEAAISPASTGDGPRNMLTATAAQSRKRAGTDGASALLNHHHHHHHYQTTISITTIELCGAADAR